MIMRCNGTAAGMEERTVSSCKPQTFLSGPLIEDVDSWPDFVVDGSLTYRGCYQTEVSLSQKPPSQN